MQLTEIAEKILEKRYYLKHENGNVIEDFTGLCWRVANTAILADLKRFEKGDSKFNSTNELEGLRQSFFDMMHNGDFLPNSPTLMNAGKEDGQLSACFVLPIEDSMEGIFDTIKAAALIHKSGGGTGFSFSRLRAKGSRVKSTNGVASGPISFLKVFNAATEAVKQGGARRGMFSAS
jgi:ribonucleoside-diphosphate reductase alpha chain